MHQPALDNLLRVGQLKANSRPTQGQLKAEPRNPAELRRLLTMAQTRLADARLAGVSPEGRFISAYNAAHAASLAALRWHGFRSENRYENAEQVPGIQTCERRVFSIQRLARATFSTYGLVQCFPISSFSVWRTPSIGRPSALREATQGGQRRLRYAIQHLEQSLGRTGRAAFALLPIADGVQ